MSNGKINRFVIFVAIGCSFGLLANCQEFCPEGWTWYKTAFCVKLVEYPVPKEYALGMCQLETRDSSLTSIGSEDELVFLSELVFNHNQSAQSIWTGGVIKQDATGFQWQDGTEIPRSSSLWDTGSPSNPPSRNKGCIQMTRQSGKLTDVSCSELNYVLCRLLPPWSKLEKVDANIIQEISDIKLELKRLEQIIDGILTPTSTTP